MNPKRDCEYLESRTARAEIIGKLASRIVKIVEQTDAKIEFDQRTNPLAVNNDLTVALESLGLGKHILVVRMDKSNRKVLDHFLTPTSMMKSQASGGATG